MCTFVNLCRFPQILPTIDPLPPTELFSQTPYCSTISFYFFLIIILVLYVCVCVCKAKLITSDVNHIMIKPL